MVTSVSRWWAARGLVRVGFPVPLPLREEALADVIRVPESLFEFES